MHGPLNAKQKILFVFQELRSKQHTLPTNCPESNSKQAAHPSGSH